MQTRGMCTCTLMSTDVTTTKLPKIASTLAEEEQDSYETTDFDSNSSQLTTFVMAAQFSTCQEGI